MLCTQYRVSGQTRNILLSTSCLDWRHISRGVGETCSLHPPLIVIQQIDCRGLYIYKASIHVYVHLQCISNKCMLLVLGLSVSVDALGQLSAIIILFVFKNVDQYFFFLSSERGYVQICNTKSPILEYQLIFAI